MIQSFRYLKLKTVKLKNLQHCHLLSLIPSATHFHLEFYFVFTQIPAQVQTVMMVLTDVISKSLANEASYNKTNTQSFKLTCGQDQSYNHSSKHKNSTATNIFFG